MNCIAFIPARCGSKSIPMKNIKPFCGRPLIYWNLLELENTLEVTSVVVATDCDTIQNVVNSFGFSKVHVYRRQETNARDSSSTESVMLEYLDALSIPDEDSFMLVQATSPFTTREHFGKALQQFISGDADSLLTCVRQKRFIWSADGIPINYDFNKRPRRQDFDGYLIENGAFYVNKVGNIKENHCRLSGKISIFEMPDFTAIEIDEESDWVVAEALMKSMAGVTKTLAPIKLVATDVDGVLTDAGMYYGEGGDEMKKFNTRDGKGFELLRERGIKTVILTSETTGLVDRRAKKIKADYLVQGVSGHEKLSALKSICIKESIKLTECAYIGDDVNCIEVLKSVGMAFCPADAEADVKSIPDIFVLAKNGGQGAFREVTSRILALSK